MLKKHAHIMYIEMENVIHKINIYIDKCSSIIMQKMHTHTHTHTRTHARTHTHAHKHRYSHFCIYNLYSLKRKLFHVCVFKYCFIFVRRKNRRKTEEENKKTERVGVGGQSETRLNTSVYTAYMYV